MHGHKSPSLPNEEAYVKSVLEMSRSRRTRKKLEERDKFYQQLHEYEMLKQKQSPNSRSPSISSTPGLQPIQPSYSSPTINSAVRRASITYAHEQTKQLSDERSNFFQKQMEELKNLQAKEVIDMCLNPGNNADDALSSMQVDLEPPSFLKISAIHGASGLDSSSFVGRNNTSPLSNVEKNLVESPSYSSPSHSKQYEEERRKRIAARTQQFLSSADSKAREELGVPPSPFKPQLTSAVKTPQKTQPLTVINTTYQFPRSPSSPSYRQPQQQIVSSQQQFTIASKSPSKPGINRPSSAGPNRPSGAIPKTSQHRSNNVQSKTAKTQQKLNDNTWLAVDVQPKYYEDTKQFESNIEERKKKMELRNSNIDSLFYKPLPLNSIELQERLVLDEIEKLDAQLQQNASRKEVPLVAQSMPGVDYKRATSPKQAKVTSSFDRSMLQSRTPRKDAWVENDKATSDDVKTRRSQTPTSARRSVTSSNTSSVPRPQSFENAKELSIEEVVKKNKEKFSHIRPRVSTHRFESEDVPPQLQHKQIRPGSASRVSSRPQQTTYNSSQLRTSLQQNPNQTPTKRSTSMPKGRQTPTTNTHSSGALNRVNKPVVSVNVNLKNILMESEEYKRVWSEIEQEDEKLLNITREQPYRSMDSFIRREMDIPSDESDVESYGSSLASINSSTIHKGYTKAEQDPAVIKKLMELRIEELQRGLNLINKKLENEQLTEHSLSKLDASFSHEQTEEQEDQERNAQTKEQVEDQENEDIIADPPTNEKSEQNMYTENFNIQLKEIAGLDELDASHIDVSEGSDVTEEEDATTENKEQMVPSILNETSNTSFNISQIASNTDFRQFIQEKLESLEELEKNSQTDAEIK